MGTRAFHEHNNVSSKIINDIIYEQIYVFVCLLSLLSSANSLNLNKSQAVQGGQVGQTANSSLRKVYQECIKN